MLVVTHSWGSTGRDARVPGKAGMLCVKLDQGMLCLVRSDSAVIVNQSFCFCSACAEYLRPGRTSSHNISLHAIAARGHSQLASFARGQAHVPRGGNQFSGFSDGTWAAGTFFLLDCLQLEEVTFGYDLARVAARYAE